MEIISNKNLDINDLSKPLVISYDNEITEQTNRFITTLENNNWDYMIVGKGEIWKGFIGRTIKYNDILSSLPSNKIVVLSDARDVYCCRTSKSFIEAFNTFNQKNIISTELFLLGKLNWTDEMIKNYDLWQGVPVTNYWNYHNIKNLPDRKYVNAGLIAGKVSNLIDQLTWQIDFCNKNKITDDQLALTHYINTFPEKIILDHNASILHTSTFGVNAGIQNVHIQKTDSPSFAEFYGRGAYFLHIPGSANKGQKEIYEISWKFIKLGVSSKSLLDLYNYPEIKWNEVF
jgi:hypothetical protein